jgi:hypothetical protein
MDRWLGLSVMTPLGLVLGAAAGGYLLYVRVVRQPHTAPADVPARSGTDNASEGETR